MLPFAAGFWAVLPAFEALLVPPAFRGPFAAHAAILIPAFLAYAFIQYALNPVFQLARRTGPVVVAAVAALAVDAVCLAMLPGLLGKLGVAAAQLAALTGALALIGLAAIRSGGLRWPWRDLGASLLATGLMLLAIWPLRSVPPALALPGAILGGALVYGALAYALDIAAMRGLAQQTLARWRKLAAPEAVTAQSSPGAAE